MAVFLKICLIIWGLSLVLLCILVPIWIKNAGEETEEDRKRALKELSKGSSRRD